LAQSNDQHHPAKKLPDDWQQGDIVYIAGLPFVFMADLRNPLTDPSKEFLSGEGQVAPDNPYAAVTIDVKGFVVISQTCDLIRDFTDAPTVQLATIEKVSPSVFAGVKKRTTIRYLFLPELEPELIVANLDQVLTVEKAILLAIKPKQRKCAVRNDVEAQILSEGIARKFSRFAFPDEFTEALSKFRNSIIGRHDKNSQAGRTFQALKEIRVANSNGWADLKSEIEFLFLFENDEDITQECGSCIDDLMNHFVVNERFPVIPSFRCVTFKDITADTYRRSLLLDLNFLSIPAK
jgi:hypothetical protein